MVTTAHDLVEEWARRGSTLDVGDERVWVADLPASRADAPPVLVVHGFPTSSIDWRRVVGDWSERRRVVLLDLPGYGLSSKPDRRYSLFEQADVVEAVARALGLTEVALVTHDMGDSVGGELLARDLDGDLGFAVERRVLSNGSIYLELAQLTEGQKLLRSLPDEMLPDDAGPDAGAMAGALRATMADEVAVDGFDVELAAMADLVTRDGGGRLLPRLIRYLDERAEHEGRWTAAIERHPAPLTVVWGDRDPIAVFAMVERLAERRPDATVVRLEGAGHYPMVEAPERFGSAVAAALA